MPSRCTDDHQIREVIVASGDPRLFPELDIPPSTTRTWLKVGKHEVVAVRSPGTQLYIRVAWLEEQQIFQANSSRAG